MCSELIHGCLYTYSFVFKKGAALEERRSVGRVGMALACGCQVALRVWAVRVELLIPRFSSLLGVFSSFIRQVFKTQSPFVIMTSMVVSSSIGVDLTRREREALSL